MIMLITGTPGGGKSLKAAYQIINELRMKKNVITNFPCDFDNYKKDFKGASRHTFIDDDDLSVEFLVSYALKNHTPGLEHQTSIYLDEPDIFNPRDFSRSDRRRWITFMRLHRKLGFDIYLITQDEILIDKQIRKFIEVERRCRSVQHYKTFGFILSLLCGGKLFIYNDSWYSAKPHLAITYGFYRLHKRKARIYDSFNLFGTYDDIIQALDFSPSAVASERVLSEEVAAEGKVSADDDNRSDAGSDWTGEGSFIY